ALRIVTRACDRNETTERTGDHTRHLVSPADVQSVLHRTSMRAGHDAQTTTLFGNISESQPAGDERFGLDIPVRRILVIGEGATSASRLDNQHIPESSCAGPKQRFDDIHQARVCRKLVEARVVLRDAISLYQLDGALCIEGCLDKLLVWRAILIRRDERF